MWELLTLFHKFLSSTTISVGTSVLAKSKVQLLISLQALIAWSTSVRDFKILQPNIQLMLDSTEEVENASLNVPRAMWWSFVLNVVMGLAMLVVTTLFCIRDLNSHQLQCPILNLFRTPAPTHRLMHS